MKIDLGEAIKLCFQPEKAVDLLGVLGNEINVAAKQETSGKKTNRKFDDSMRELKKTSM